MPNTDDPYSMDYDMNPRSCELEHPRLEVVRIYPRRFTGRATKSDCAALGVHVPKESEGYFQLSSEELAEEIATAVELKNENKK